MKKTTLAIAAFAAAITTSALATPVLADEIPSTMVSYGDLDLSDAADLAELDRRIGEAVRKVCRMDGRTMAEHRRASVCRAEARAAALLQIERAVTLSQRVGKDGRAADRG